MKLLKNGIVRETDDPAKVKKLLAAGWEDITPPAPAEQEADKKAAAEKAAADKKA